MGEVRHNEAQHRFELDAEGELAVAVYRPGPGPGVLSLVHTEVPAHLAGRGLGSQLVRGTLELVRADGLKIVPRCSFVAGFIARHPQYRDLVA